MSRIKKRLKFLPIHVILIFSAIIFLFPFYYMVVTGFKTNQEFYDNTFAPPQEWSLNNMESLVTDHHFIRYFFNSAIVTSFSGVLALITSSLAGYAYAKMTFSGKGFLLSMSIAFTGIPPIIVVIPMYVLMSRMQLLNTYFGVSIIYAGFLIPFSVFVLTSFFRSIPNELLNAAEIDGCNRFMRLTRIMLPLSKPVLTTVIIINGLWVWNELLIALMFLRSELKRTIAVGLAQLGGRYAINPTLVQAGALFVAIPIIVIYLIGQKYFVRGLSAGALKE
jgi:ABC-type glycerol-3-phosphate transport system permease component